MKDELTILMKGRRTRLAIQAAWSLALFAEDLAHSFEGKREEREDHSLRDRFSRKL